jgi:hypothetical protein
MSQRRKEKNGKRKDILKNCTLWIVSFLFPFFSLGHSS